MEKSIYRYIIRYSMRRQVVLTIMATASFPFLYAFYELPKLIVNSAIQGKDTTFPTSVSQIQFDQVEYLWLLCGIFLGLVIINQAFKYVINVYAGITGERMLRRLRFDLYGRVLRFPLPQFRKTSSSEIVTMVTAEIEPLGGFIGDAFKLPIFQGGYLIVILAFLFVQNWYMALAAVALYPLQGYLIPKLQRRVNLLGKERVRLVRQLSDRIGETVAGELHAWVEWWDNGWHSWDVATNREPNDHYITLATGRDYRDVKPLSGIYSGSETAEMTVEVEITRLA